MATKSIDADNLTVTGAHRALRDQNIRVESEVIVIVTQAFGPGGDDLMAASQVDFDGYPAVPVLVRAAGREEIVHLSPFHGDRRKTGMEGLPAGTKCELLCPVSKKPLDHVGKVAPESDADYFAIYLTKRLSEGEMVAISDVWDDYHSRIVDNFELISFWSVDAGE